MVPVIRRRAQSEGISTTATSAGRADQIFPRDLIACVRWAARQSGRSPAFHKASSLLVVDYVSEKVVFRGGRFSLSLSLSVLWREEELRIEDRKEKEKNEGEEEARERERERERELVNALSRRAPDWIWPT